jgi:hypothetical protein
MTSFQQNFKNPLPLLNFGAESKNSLILTAREPKGPSIGEGGPGSSDMKR